MTPAYSNTRAVEFFDPRSIIGAEGPLTDTSLLESLFPRPLLSYTFLLRLAGPNMRRIPQIDLVQLLASDPHNPEVMKFLAIGDADYFLIPAPSLPAYRSAWLDYFDSQSWAKLVYQESRLSVYQILPAAPWKQKH